MKKLLTVQLLLLCLITVASCSKDEAVKPDPLLSPESLATTKWLWVSYGDKTGDEISLDPAKSIQINFIDGSNVERISKDQDGQTSITQFSYQISKDTLIAYEKAEVNYFVLKEHTATNLTLNRVKYIKLDTHEEFASTGIFKYNKVAD